MTAELQAVADRVAECFRKVEAAARGESFGEEEVFVIDSCREGLVQLERLRALNGSTGVPEAKEPQDRFLRAIVFAEEAHRGQVYRGYGGRRDEPYYLHPLRVALAVREGSRVVAMLHDVFEDTRALAPEWLTDDERIALFTLTRGKDESYEDYIGRVASALPSSANMAREVKRADLRDNLANDPPPRLRTRYEAALERLGGSPQSDVAGERLEEGPVDVDAIIELAAQSWAIQHPNVVVPSNGIMCGIMAALHYLAAPLEQQQEGPQ